jgi:DNA replication and repair protein RecF
LLLRSLRFTSVRNLAAVTLEPAPRFNVFFGDNGQGKTNLLEAIYVASVLRSFRTQRLAELIAFGAEEARISAEIFRDDLIRRCDVVLRERSRVVRLDGKSVRPIAKYFGQFNVVLFAPEDLQIPRGSPANRRRFLDRAVFNHNLQYLSDVRGYDRVLRHRNALLREIDSDYHAGKKAMDLLAVLDDQLADLGARVINSRRAFLEKLRPHVDVAFESITRMGLSVDVEYVASEQVMASGKDLSSVLLELLQKARSTDLRRRVTSIGPHRDDLMFLLEGQRAAAFASQGQLRALVLAWKTAELELLAETHDESPILLLDDVSSELDQNRNQYLFQFLRHRVNQCFITTTHPKHVLLTSDRVDYEVDSGAVTRRDSR